MVRRIWLLVVLLMPVCAWAILGDLNRDGQVNFDDFFLLSDHFGEKGPPDPPDTVWVVRIDTLRQVVRDTVEVVRVDTLLITKLDTTKTAVVDLPGGATMEFVWIKPGIFTMGSPLSEVGLDREEGPQHQVTISGGFYLGKYEITQGQWSAVMGTNLWLGKTVQADNVQANPNNPAVEISWNDVQGFIHRLNQAAGDSLYRLPTEAEWEYACRAGTTTRWSFGDDKRNLGDYAWYDANAWNVREDYAHAVGRKQPNPWGLYDMHGNVWELVQDWYDIYSSEAQIDPTGPESARVGASSRAIPGAYRAIRGEGFQGNDPRSAVRSLLPPDGRSFSTGARLVRIK